MRKIYILMIAILAMVYRVPIDQGRPAGQMFGPGLRKGARESVQMAVTGMVLLMTLFAVLGTLLVAGREVRESQALWWAMGATTIWALAHGAFVFGVFMAASRDALKNGNDADQRRYEALERIRKPVVGTPSGQAYAGGQITQAPPDFYLLGYFDAVMVRAMLEHTTVPKGHIGFSYTTTDTHSVPIYGRLPLFPVPGDDTTSLQECIADSNDAPTTGDVPTEDDSPMPGTVRDVYDINGVKYVRTSAMDAPTAPPPPEDVAPQVNEDTKLLDYLRHSGCDLRCYAVDAGGEDADVRWLVVEHHLDAPQEREIGRSYNDDPRTAIRAAMHSPTTGTRIPDAPDALGDDAPLVDLVVRLSAELRGVDPDNGMANKAMAILDERVLSNKAKEDAYDRVFAKLSAMTPVELAERLKKYEKDPFVATLRTLAQQDEAHATHTGAIVPRHWGLPLNWREDFDCHKTNVDAADEPTTMTPRAYALSVLNLLQADLARKERYQDHNPGHSLSCLYNYMLQRTGLTDSRTARVVFFDQFPEYHMAMGALENKQAECPVIDLCDCPICHKDENRKPEYLLLAPGDDGRVPSVSGRTMARINRGLTMLMEKGVEITDLQGMQTVREMRDAIQTVIDTISIRGGELNDDTPITMYGWDTENLQHMANALRKEGFIAPWEFVQTVIDCTPSVRPPGETLGRKIHDHFTRAIECNRLQNREDEPHTLHELEWLAQGFAMAYGIPPGDTRLVALAGTLPYLSKEHRIEPGDRSAGACATYARHYGGKADRDRSDETQA